MKRILRNMYYKFKDSLFYRSVFRGELLLKKRHEFSSDAVENKLGINIHKAFNFIVILTALLLTLSATAVIVLNPYTIGVLGAILATYVLMSLVRRISNYIYREYYLPLRIQKKEYDLDGHFARQMVSFVIVLVVVAVVAVTIFFALPYLLPLVLSSIGLYLIASLASLIAIQAIYSNNAFLKAWRNKADLQTMNNKARSYSTHLDKRELRNTSTVINKDRNPFNPVNLYRAALLTFVAVILLALLSNPFSAGIATIILISITAIIALQSFMNMNVKEHNQIIGQGNYASLFMTHRFMPKPEEELSPSVKNSYDSKSIMVLESDSSSQASSEYTSNDYESDNDSINSNDYDGVVWDDFQGEPENKTELNPSKRSSSTDSLNSSEGLTSNETVSRNNSSDGEEPRNSNHRLN
ncbi:MAG: hypothetical protein P8L77_00790 [Gammaproteobacteria bacterium]|nr:hypothetical protein [Gammaproteobacteria bacterium]